MRFVGRRNSVHEPENAAAPRSRQDSSWSNLISGVSSVDPLFFDTIWRTRPNREEEGTLGRTGPNGWGVDPWGFFAIAPNSLRVLQEY